MNWQIVIYRAALIAIFPFVIAEAVIREVVRAWRNFNARYEIRRHVRLWKRDWRDVE